MTGSTAPGGGNILSFKNDAKLIKDKVIQICNEKP